MKKLLLHVLSMCLVAGGTWCALSLIYPAAAAETSVAPAAAVENPQEKAEDAQDVVKAEKNNEFGLLAIGVGLAVLGGAIGTGLAQKGIGTAVVAACAENRSFLGTGIFLLALPETILIIACGLAFLLLRNIH